MGVVGDQLQVAGTPGVGQFVRDGQFVVDQQIDEPPPDAEFQFVGRVQINLAILRPLGRVLIARAIVVRYLRLRPAGIGAHVGQRLLWRHHIKADADRLPHRAAERPKLEGCLKILRRRLLQDQHPPLVPCRGLDQFAVFVNPFAAGGFLPPVGTGLGKVVGDQCDGLGRRFCRFRFRRRLGGRRILGLGEFLPGERHRRAGLGDLLVRLLQMRFQHKRPQAGMNDFRGERHRRDLPRCLRKEPGNGRIDNTICVRIAVVATDMHKCFGVQVAVKGPWQAVLFDVGHARQQFRANLIGFENRPQAVVLDLAERIVFVVVALRAIERESQHRLGGVFDRLIEPAGAIELEVLPGQVAGSPKAVEVVGIQFVRGDHLAKHLVVALVGVQGLDRPIPPAPDMFLRVPDLRAQPPPVAVTPDVQPVPAPAFAVLRAGKQPVDDLLRRLR